jgi:hypothetical protein
MSSLIRVRNISRNPLRIGATGVPVVGPTGAATAVQVDLDDPNVRRDLARTFPRWVLEGPLASASTLIANGNITTVFRENFNRGSINADTAAALTTAVMTCVAVPVGGGDVVSNVSVASGATAASVPLNQWAALYTPPVASAAVSLTINATGGTFTITYNAQTTAAIAWNATPAAVQAALWLISSVTPNGVLVTGTAATATTVGVYRITFTGPNAGVVSVGAVTASGASLTGGAGTAVPAVVTNEAWAANTPKTFALAAPYTVPDDGYVIAAIGVKATTVPSLASYATALAASTVGYLSNQIRLCFTSGSALTATAPATLLLPVGQSAVPYVVLT